MKALPRIPGYELLTCLGGGVITTVYSARACETDAPCAVKVLRPDWDDQPVAVKLLQREARAALSTRHPHLVRVLDAHVLTPPFFLVMEYLAGESLRRRIRRDYCLPAPTALWIVRQIAEALSALHRKDFIHGDIKPENIRLVDVGQAFLSGAAGKDACPTGGKAILLDLGFAHRPGENASFLDKGYILGTANYLAPEQCGTEPHDDARADIYSLGVTLFEMLTGQLPFPAAPPRETMQAHRTLDPLLLTDFRPDAPAALTELVDRMLARDPQNRPRTDRLVHELVGYEIQSLGQRRAA